LINDVLLDKRSMTQLTLAPTSSQTEPLYSAESGGVVTLSNDQSLVTRDADALTAIVASLNRAYTVNMWARFNEYGLSYPTPEYHQMFGVGSSVSRRGLGLSGYVEGTWMDVTLTSTWHTNVSLSTTSAWRPAVGTVLANINESGSLMLARIVQLGPSVTSPAPYTFVVRPHRPLELPFIWNTSSFGTRKLFSVMTHTVTANVSSDTALATLTVATTSLRPHVGSIVIGFVNGKSIVATVISKSVSDDRVVTIGPFDRVLYPFTWGASAINVTFEVVTVYTTWRLHHGWYGVDHAVTVPTTLATGLTLNARKPDAEFSDWHMFTVSWAPASSAIPFTVTVASQVFTVTSGVHTVPAVGVAFSGSFPTPGTFTVASVDRDKKTFTVRESYGLGDITSSITMTPVYKRQTYMDGIKIGEDAPTGAPDFSNEALYIGRRVNLPSASNVRAQFSNFRMWDSQLVDTDVVRLWRETHPGVAVGRVSDSAIGYMEVVSSSRADLVLDGARLPFVNVTAWGASYNVEKGTVAITGGNALKIVSAGSDRLYNLAVEFCAAYTVNIWAASSDYALSNYDLFGFGTSENLCALGLKFWSAGTLWHPHCMWYNYDLSSADVPASVGTIKTLNASRPTMHMYTVTWSVADGGLRKVFVDGVRVMVDAPTIAPTFARAPPTLNLGRFVNSYSNGAIVNTIGGFRLWNTQLSEAAINQLYSEGAR